MSKRVSAAIIDLADHGFFGTAEDGSRNSPSERQAPAIHTIKRLSDRHSSSLEDNDHSYRIASDINEDKVGLKSPQPIANTRDTNTGGGHNFTSLLWKNLKTDTTNGRRSRLSEEGAGGTKSVKNPHNI